MSYAHIPNLYKDTKILLVRECYALEKIHGTNAYIDYREGKVWFSAGGANTARFAALFDKKGLEAKFIKLFDKGYVRVYGEAYGGSTLKQAHRYGKELRFVAYDVRVKGLTNAGAEANHWLSVQDAIDVTSQLGLEFVHYVKVEATVEALDRERDEPSMQAFRNGMGKKTREGIVVRPLVELTLNNGERLIAKHKGAEFMETATERSVEVDPARLKVLDDAKAIAMEWVTPNRLEHVLGHLTPSLRVLAETEHVFSVKDIPRVIDAMVEDVVREAGNEIVDSKEARRAISNRAAELFRLWRERP